MLVSRGFRVQRIVKLIFQSCLSLKNEYTWSDFPGKDTVDCNCWFIIIAGLKYTYIYKNK